MSARVPERRSACCLRSGRVFVDTLRADKLQALSVFFGMRGLCDGGFGEFG